jgi:hypothetical protein
MKIVLTRSFSRTKQIAAFEPINAYCSVQVEYEQSADETDVQVSERLDEFARTEVEKTIDAEIARRKTPDHSKIQDSAKAEAEHDSGQQSLDLVIDKEASGKGYREIN